ncbi:hypothetical protein ACIPQA_16375 [Streptomyces sp. NPDC090109]|uniref:hypothetical protein n=1 Tax=Streptomyces sp. NPDC090109 TaxID=3365948 RepID=UPI00382ABFD4
MTRQLHDPTSYTNSIVLDVDSARSLAREDLDHVADADINDHGAMIRAAVTLEMRLRSLLTALDAQENRTP